MRPHPYFRENSIPMSQTLGSYSLKALNVTDNDRDYSAIMESVKNIRSASPNLTWPSGLTLEKNFIDLAWHQKEFEASRSFAWIIEDHSTEYMGCVYVYPSIDGSRSADVAWWWRRGYETHHSDFGTLFMDWLAGPDWPELEYQKIII